MNKKHFGGKVMALAMATLLTTSCVSLAGCGGSGDGPDIDSNKYGERSRSFTFSYYQGGYGTDWLQAVTDDYMLNVNKDVYIDLKRSTNNDTARTNIKTGVGTYDLYEIEVDMFNHTDVLEDMSDLYNREVYGEPGVKVQDKLGARWVDYYKEGETWYAMPFTQCTGWNYAYNKTLIDEKLGEGKWSLPRTTDEFFALGDELYKNGVYLTAFPGADTAGGDYSRYGMELWFAQMLGLEGYDRYMNGYYLDDNGEWQFCYDEPMQVKRNSSAITEAYKVAEKLCSPAASVKDTQYMHKYSASMQFKDVDVMIYGGKYRGQKTEPIAMLYVGGWLETEVEPFIKAGTISGDQEVRAMKMPVISAIIERTPTINDEATLTAVIDYVDGVTTTKPAGVSDADVEIIREARNMVSELICRQFVITKTAKNKEDIKDFLAYLASDRAQKLAAQATDGIAILPYGYVPTEEDMGYKISQYTNDVTAIANDAVIVDIGKLKNYYAGFFGLNWYIDSMASGGTIALNLFTKQAESSATIAESTYKKVNATYAEYMKLFQVNYPHLYPERTNG